QVGDRGDEEPRQVPRPERPRQVLATRHPPRATAPAGRTSADRLSRTGSRTDATIMHNSFLHPMVTKEERLGAAFPTSVSYVVVGAGIHGLSTAWHLAMELEARK